MDKETNVILRVFAQVGLNNQVISLKENQDIIIQKSKNEIANLTEQNHELRKAVASLQKENIELKNSNLYNEQLVNKIPKFLVKILSKNKNIKLLEKGK